MVYGSILSCLIKKEAVEITGQSPKQRDPQKESTSGRILIVEDDDQMRKTLRLMLEGEGYEVVEAPDGKIALKRYSENPTDLIITDLIMPEKGGLGLIRELRHDFPEVKIIAISGGGRLGPVEYLTLSEELGALQTLEKPFKKEEFLKAVRTVLKSQ